MFATELCDVVFKGCLEDGFGDCVFLAEEDGCPIEDGVVQQDVQGVRHYLVEVELLERFRRR